LVVSCWRCKTFYYNRNAV